MNAVMSQNLSRLYTQLLHTRRDLMRMPPVSRDPLGLYAAEATKLRREVTRLENEIKECEEG